MYAERLLLCRSFAGIACINKTSVYIEVSPAPRGAKYILTFQSYIKLLLSLLWKRHFSKCCDRTPDHVPHIVTPLNGCCINKVCH